MIITMDPSLVYCFCKKGEDSNFIKITELCLGPPATHWYFGGGFGPVQGRQHENSNGADQHIEFLDRKARTECSAGAETYPFPILSLP